ncbi:MAG: hypothetical protein CLLPBCKN_001961 [Chroococcidiopsis cubana SAG 39.79]|jgi:uncharacterized protein (DUF433 family)|uniref:DUF433 domain-containing protein n=2 Tax=Chroococcidiopsis TaxID=54298 RepID=K9TZL5_CHRTP|nr:MULTISPECIES: DUF433 domain-containing protein [Chroococcidiopsis]PSB45083.1 DUF433 domain-containing protein [Cyanosarcina cf. burmensis CCALA 770]AFY88030.1 protein of unknown function DUF433 [Chroococcidiopsis thermalis PCC 7203]MDZ4872573.1 hypothetical protein [Chroococcidiopsis cubana SAG 39.79]PSB64482.1 DUF433 domain-containing protein [Chroococcidiopsis cubana CCALA 043]RUT13781.1 hypothetical protein DSM107010_10560 [Chroococcidiopsis cubana SAG 39.79]
MTTTTVDIGTLIDRTPGLHGGVPHISGKGVTVRRIVSWYKRGLAAEEIGDRIGNITLAEVYAALAYYHANVAEIEADIAHQAAEDQRLEKLDRSSTRSMA